jgi:dimethyladenosine transferase 1
MSPNHLIRNTLPAVRDLVRIYGLEAKSQLSQNFILDKNVTDKIIRSARLPFQKSLVVEVGPGPGLLTRSILDAGVEHLVVVEKDARFLPSLEQLKDACHPDHQIHIIHGDILTTKHEDIIQHFPNDIQHVHIIGNLPFNIATPLLVKWLHNIESKDGLFKIAPWTMTLMFQKEVAERITATPHTSQRSRLSIMSQTVCDTRITYRVPPTVFVPQPKVSLTR